MQDRTDARSEVPPDASELTNGGFYFARTHLKINDESLQIVAATADNCSRERQLAGIGPSLTSAFTRACNQPDDQSAVRRGAGGDRLGMPGVGQQSPRFALRTARRRYLAPRRIRSCPGVGGPG